MIIVIRFLLVYIPVFFLGVISGLCEILAALISWDEDYMDFRLVEKIMFKRSENENE